jgi:hypothetical protein
MTTYSYVPAPNPRWQEFQDYVVQTSPAVFQFSANSVTSIISCATDPHYYTGLAVNVSTNDILPTPLSNSIPYYIIVVSLNSYRLATSYANALANVYVTITDAGTGIQSITTAGQVYLIPLANGYIRTSSSKDHSVRKPTYTDWTGDTALPNPIQLNNVGQALIYWAINQGDATDNYFLEVYNAIGVLMYVLDNFNAPGGSGGVIPSSSVVINHGRNAAFTYWDLCDWDPAIAEPDFNVSTLPSSRFTEVANEWFFTKNNDNATDKITRKKFTAGETNPPNNSVYYLEFQCTSAGSGGETSKNIYQPSENVQTFNGESVAVSFWMKAASSTTIVIDALQYFGAGGSTSRETLGALCPVTTAWSQCNAIINVPSVTGQNIRPGSFFAVRVNLPFNSTITLDIANYQITQTATVQSYVQSTLEEQATTLTPRGYVADTGEIRIYPQALSTVPRTWVRMSNGTIGNSLSNATILASPDSKSLFLFLWNTYSNVECPVYTSAGIKAARGADAITDYNANVQIALWTNEGRVIANVGTPQFVFDYAMNDTSSNTMTVTATGDMANYNLYTGTPITVVTTGTLPSGLALSTVYYLIATGTINQYKFASTLANAVAVPPVFLTVGASGVGTGINSIEFLQDTHANGQFYGENSHAILQDQGPLHNHHRPGAAAFYGIENPFTTLPHTGFTQDSGDFVGSTVNIPSSGNNNPINIVQPTLSLPMIIKL